MLRQHSATRRALLCGRGVRLTTIAAAVATTAVATAVATAAVATSALATSGDIALLLKVVDAGQLGQRGGRLESALRASDNETVRTLARCTYQQHGEQDLDDKEEL